MCPAWVWRARGLVVQPLYVERRGDLFAMNQWYFLGDHECVSTLLSRSPVVKIANVAEFCRCTRTCPTKFVDGAKSSSSITASSTT